MPEPIKIIERPKALMCYICGREYGTLSLEIHLKACRKKWDIEQAKKPVEMRKPCPEPPLNFDQAISGAKAGSYDFQTYNDAAFENYNIKALEKCPNCPRTFNPESLPKHLKMCRPKDPTDESLPTIPSIDK